MGGPQGGNRFDQDVGALAGHQAPDVHHQGAVLGEAEAAPDGETLRR